MDTAFAALRTTATIFVVVAISFGIYLHQLARITASTAAVATATAAAQTLDGTGWDCTTSHTVWAEAEEAAAQAAATRTGARSAATATGYTLTAEPSCTVVATVTVGAAGVPQVVGSHRGGLPAFTSRRRHRLGGRAAVLVEPAHRWGLNVDEAAALAVGPTDG